MMYGPAEKGWQWFDICLVLACSACVLPGADTCVVEGYHARVGRGEYVQWGEVCHRE